MKRKGEKETSEKNPRAATLNSASSEFITDDSEQGLGLSPNRSGCSYRNDFGGNSGLYNLAGGDPTAPFTPASEAESEKTAALLMASAPLSRPYECNGEGRKRRMKK
jgi:hypothetical protein